MGWITRRLGRRSLENPNLPLDDPDAWDEAGLFQRSAAGVRVTRQTALTCSAVFRGTSLISNALAKTPLVVQSTDGRNHQPDKTHDAYRLLRHEFSPELLAFHAIQSGTAHAILQGGAFFYIVRDRLGRPLELWQLRPDRTTPARENGNLVYATSLGGAMGETGSETRKLPAADVIHVHGLGFDGLTGYSLLTLAADAIGSSIAKERFGAKFFRNSATPSVAIKVPKQLSDTAFKHLKDSWNSITTGLDNAHKPIILEDNSELTPFSVNAADAQLIEAQKFDLVVLANFLSLPVHKLGGDGRTSYNSLEQENQAYLDDALDPWFCAWESELRRRLLTEAEKRNESHQIKYRRQALVRVDMTRRYAAYRTGLGGQPFLQVSEPRQLEDLPAVDGTEFIPSPLNMGKLGDTPPAADPPADPDPAEASRRETMRTIFEQTLGRMARRLATAAAKAAKRNESPAFADHESTIHEALDPVCELLELNSDAVVDRLQFDLEGRSDPDPEHWAQGLPARICEHFLEESSE